MVTQAEFSDFVAARGVELGPDVDVVVTSGGTLGRLVDLAEDLGLVILGLDGFRVNGAVIVPLIDFIADFSSIEGPWASRVHASALASREVSCEWSPMPDLVEVILAGFDDDPVKAARKLPWWDAGLE